MNRRTVIKNLALVIGGAALLPSCLQDKSKASIGLKHININADQEKLIGDISDTIIPKTDTPGARDFNLHLFVLKMVDDCYKKADQQTFLAGMDQFNELTQKRYGHSFADCAVKERELMLKDIEQKNNYPAQLNAFYRIVKEQTVFGYTNSKYFMTKQVIYELVPGRYNAYYPVKKLKAV